MEEYEMSDGELNKLCELLWKYSKWKYDKYSDFAERKITVDVLLNEITSTLFEHPNIKSSVRK